MGNIPFTGIFGPDQPLPTLPGYLTRIQGVFLSLGPFGSVTGFAQFSINGLANGETLGAGAGGIVIDVMPSTTDVVNLPLFFGEQGIAASAPGVAYPVTVGLNPSGSDTPGNVQINIWGVLEEVG